MENDPFMQLFLIILISGFGLVIPFMFFWFWVSRKGWASVRLFSASFGVLILLAGIILWFQVKETWLLIFTFISSLVASLMILTWPVTAPRIIEKLNLKW